MWRSILAWSLYIAMLGAALVAACFAFRTIALGVTVAQPFWIFAADVGITAALTILATGLGIAALEADKKPV